MKQILIHECDFELFKAIKGRKTYIVGGSYYLHAKAYACKHFKTTKEHIKTFIGFVYRGELYLEDPEKSGSRAVWVSTWKK